uniref:Predicted RNA methylase n=1 Tax=Candidatus Kentrum sp. DK TaxID=2126562 RepID=A0A450T2T9_9GAMM|nr:MAG: Predicted RNA methylase [Candidatus Kentron sp. DK]
MQNSIQEKLHIKGKLVDFMSRTNHHTPIYKEGKGNFHLSYHLEMVSDSERVQRCKDAIDYYISNESVFCELGCGTGIFSIYAAKKCEKVYAVEYDEEIIEIAKKNAEINGVADRITFLHANALEVDLPEKADLIFCEMMSIWLVNEPQVPVMNHATQNLLREGGHVIPGKVINLGELGNVDYLFDGVELRTSIAEFTGVRPPRVATESRVISTIDLYEQNEIQIRKSIEFQSLVKERLNCIRLFSIVVLAPGINFHSTDTLMPVTTTPLASDLGVLPGDDIILDVKYTHRTSINDAIFIPRKRERHF